MVSSVVWERLEHACQRRGQQGRWKPGHPLWCSHCGQSAFASFYCCKSLSTGVTYLWLPDAAHLIMCVYQVRLNSPGQESYHTRVCIGGEHPAWRWMKSDDAVTFSQRAALLGNCCPRKFKRVLQDWHLPNWDNINLSFYFIFLLRAK